MLKIMNEHLSKDFMSISKLCQNALKIERHAYILIFALYPKNLIRNLKVSKTFSSLYIINKHNFCKNDNI